jgi:predicted RND superfamily exporter protein
MIIAYLGFFALGVLIFFLMAKLGLPMRIGVSLAVFLIPSIILTIWVVRVGDKPPSDAITVVPRPSESEKTDSQDPE